ncbi:hypothetical protein GCM10027058_08010 [Microbacterium neimengense]
MHERVDAVVLVVDRSERVDDLAVIGQIHLHEAWSALADDIETDDLVTGRGQFANDHASELSR